MKVLVTGGNGYVGQKLKSYAADLIESDVRDVYFLERRGETFLVYGQSGAAPFSIVEEIGPLGEVGSFLKRKQIGAVVNLVASVRKGDFAEDADHLIESNISFLTQMAIHCVHAGVQRFVQASSFSTSIDGQSYTPQTLYAATKKAAEDILEYFAQAHALQTVVLDLYDIYGPDQNHARIIPLLMKAILKGEKISMSPGEQQIAPIYVDDVCEALLHACTLRVADNFSHWSVPGPEIVSVKNLPGIIYRNMATIYEGLQAPVVQHSLPYRHREIMQVRYRFPILPDWGPSTTFDHGIKMSLKAAVGDKNA